MPADAAPSFVLAAALGEPGESLTFDAEESHYLARVCRARPGDHVTATDGRGTVASLRLTDVGAVVSAEVETRERQVRRSDVWLLCGAPEGERADWMVEKLAELGVAVMQPIECERGTWHRSARRIERWRRIAVAALRQSRRPFLLEVRPPVGLEQALAALPAGGQRWLADPDGASAPGTGLDASGLTTGIVGPSGGLSERERASIAAAGFQPMRLSDGRLRTETAALAWAAWCSSRTGTARAES